MSNKCLNSSEDIREGIPQDEAPGSFFDAVIHDGMSLI